jgi:hypothetical protein
VTEVTAPDTRAGVETAPKNPRKSLTKRLFLAETARL